MTTEGENSPTIEALFDEDRHFSSSEEFRDQPYLASPTIDEQGGATESYWRTQANRVTTCKTPFAKVIDITHPRPGTARTIFNNLEGSKDIYWSKISIPKENKWIYFAEEEANEDLEWHIWLLGRVDDVMNVSGHRISTLEVEAALVDHQSVAEAAVVGRCDATTGQAIAAFVSPKGDARGAETLIVELRDHVATKIGKIARPASIVFTDELPKTRSDKIMRRLLRDISEQRQLRDVTTMSNADVVHEIATHAQASQNTVPTEQAHKSHALKTKVSKAKRDSKTYVTVKSSTQIENEMGDL